MATSYSLFEMTSFPQVQPGGSIDIRWQLPMKFPDLENVEDPITVFTLQRQIEDPAFDVYRVKYEQLEEKVGRAKGITFSRFVATYFFTAYYYRPTGLLVFKAKKDYALGAVRTLVQSDDVQGRLKYLDLKSIVDRIERFKGAWFTVPDSADVTSQAFFGPNVDLDERFQKASAEGDITNARLDYPYLDQRFHIGISSDYSLVIYVGNLDELFELELVLDIKNNLLDRADVKQEILLKPLRR